MVRPLTSSVLIASLLIAPGCLSPLTETDALGGCSGADYPDWAASEYVLPIPVGASVEIDLSNCTSSYHAQGRPDEFAIDFDLDIGATITASRPGVVVRVEESGQDFGFPNNIVVVDHRDGSYGQYMHLTRDGAAVELGDEVVWGTVIGQSGATGLAGYPHLHFVVTEGGHSWPYQSAPVTFRNTDANPRSLLSDRIYQALPW